jgi:sirohydrochlorin ferrochelatase
MPGRAVVLVDHGSREAEANAVLEAVAECVRERLPGRLVRVAHLELAPPALAEAIDACVREGAREVVVQPFFLAPGRHGGGDIPRLAREAAARHPGVTVRVTAPLGAHPGVVEAVLGRLAEALEREVAAPPSGGLRTPRQRDPE